MPEVRHDILHPFILAKACPKLIHGVKVAIIVEQLIAGPHVSDRLGNYRAILFKEADVFASVGIAVVHGPSGEVQRDSVDGGERPDEMCEAVDCILATLPSLLLVEGDESLDLFLALEQYDLIFGNRTDGSHFSHGDDGLDHYDGVLGHIYIREPETEVAVGGNEVDGFAC